MLIGSHDLSARKMKNEKWSRCVWRLPCVTPAGWTLLMKGRLVVSLRRVNFGFWSHLGCSGQNAIIFSREGLPLICRVSPPQGCDRCVALQLGPRTRFLFLPVKVACLLHVTSQLGEDCIWVSFLSFSWSPWRRLLSLVCIWNTIPYVSPHPSHLGIRKALDNIACVASVSVRFRSKERGSRAAKTDLSLLRNQMETLATQATNSYLTSTETKPELGYGYEKSEIK